VLTPGGSERWFEEIAALAPGRPGGLPRCLPAARHRVLSRFTVAEQAA
jgi:hypothetical protein